MILKCLPSHKATQILKFHILSQISYDFEILPIYETTQILKFHSIRQNSFFMILKSLPSGNRGLGWSSTGIEGDWQETPCH
jgi:hypothetical protein